MSNPQSMESYEDPGSDSPMDLLKEYENQRSKIVNKYYVKLDQIISTFHAHIKNIQDEIDSVKIEYQQKMKQAQKLAEIASKFYEKAQQMLHKPPF